ncbi:MAG: thymidylate synthase [Patescibacteria group bacterium]
MQLYKESKYKTLQGTKTNMALATCWFDPFSVPNRHTELQSLFQITGTLYSKEGVSIILRNLALNPDINQLLLWTGTPLSNTPFGKAGWKLLKSVWNDPHNLKDIHAEINSEVIELITQHVELIHIETSFEELLNIAKSHKNQARKPYMEPVSFPEPKIDESKPLPSEHVGWQVRGQTIYESWLKVVDRVIRYGEIKETAYGNNQKELQQVNWVISNDSVPYPYMPELDKNVLEIIGLNEISLENYKSSLLEKEIPEGIAYTYGSRLRNNAKVDQVEYMVNCLKDSNITRRAFATTIDLTKDTTSKSPPCLVLVTALINSSDNKLNLFATFRSHDIFKAAIPNAVGLLNLQQYMADQIGVSRGALSISSISAHIYEEDFDNATKLLKCQMWENVQTKYNELTDTDPRGYVRIYTAPNNTIKLELISPVGETLATLQGHTARDLIIKLAKLELLSKNEHYADICIELVKAELSNQIQKEYIQDKPLITKEFKLV